MWFLPLSFVGMQNSNHRLQLKKNSCQTKQHRIIWIIIYEKNYWKIDRKVYVHTVLFSDVREFRANRHHVDEWEKPTIDRNCILLIITIRITNERWWFFFRRSIYYWFFLLLFLEFFFHSWMTLDQSNLNFLQQKTYSKEYWSYLRKQILLLTLLPVWYKLSKCFKQPLNLFYQLKIDLTEPK